MKEGTEVEGLIKKESNEQEGKNIENENPKISDCTLCYYIFLIIMTFGILIFLFFYIHYSSYKVDILVTENSKI